MIKMYTTQTLEYAKAHLERDVKRMPFTVWGGYFAVKKNSEGYYDCYHKVGKPDDKQFELIIKIPKK